MSADGLLAEGQPVPDGYLTTEEANGEWREVRPIETMEELNALTPEQVKKMLDMSAKHFAFNRRSMD